MSRNSYRKLYPNEPLFWRAGMAFTTEFLRVAKSRPTAAGLRVRDPMRAGGKNSGLRLNA